MSWYKVFRNLAREIAEIRCVELVTVKTQIKGLLRKFQMQADEGDREADR